MHERKLTKEEIIGLALITMYAKTEEEFQSMKWKFIAQKLIKDCWEEKKNEIQDAEILRGFDLLDHDHSNDNS